MGSKKLAITTQTVARKLCICSRELFFWYQIKIKEQIIKTSEVILEIEKLGGFSTTSMYRTTTTRTS